MKAAQFFEMVKFSRASVTVKQDNSNGFMCVATVKHTEEHGETSKVEMVMTESVGDSTKYFMSLSSAAKTLADGDIMEFSVCMASVEIKHKVLGPRVKNTAAPAAKTATAKPANKKEEDKAKEEAKA